MKPRKQWSPSRLMKRMLGSAWGIMEQHLKETAQWTDTRAMGCNHVTGKLWFSDGERMTHLLKAKLNEQLEPELIINHQSMELIKCTTEQVEQLKIKVLASVAKKE